MKLDVVSDNLDNLIPLRFIGFLFLFQTPASYLILELTDSFWTTDIRIARHNVQ
jgi:hypothetical protein